MSDLKPSQIATAIVGFTVVVAVIGFLAENSRPSVPTAAVIPPVGAHGQPPPPEKTHQLVGPVAGNVSFTPPPPQIGSATASNGAPVAPQTGPPPPRQ